MKRRLLTTLIVMLSICSSALAAIKASGNCGKNGSDVTWTLTDDGKLTIKGNGKMADYGYPYESIDDSQAYRNGVKSYMSLTSRTRSFRKGNPLCSARYCIVKEPKRWISLKNT